MAQIQYERRRFVLPYGALLRVSAHLYVGTGGKLPAPSPPLASLHSLTSPCILTSVYLPTYRYEHLSCPLQEAKGEGWSEEVSHRRYLSGQPPTRTSATPIHTVAARLAPTREKPKIRPPLALFTRDDSPPLPPIKSLPTSYHRRTCVASCSGFALRRNPNMKRRRC